MTQCDPSNVFILVVMAFGAGLLLCGWFASAALKQRDASLRHLRVCLNAALETARKYEPDFSLANVKP
jgi:hypothetical protein